MTDTLEKLREAITLEKIKEAVRSYCEYEFGDVEDDIFEDLSHVPIAYSTTGDDKHTIQVILDLNDPKILYEIDDEVIYTENYYDLDELLEAIGEDGLGLSFDDMVAEAEDIWERAKYGE